LLRWFQQSSAGSAGISGTLLKDKALHTVTRLGIGDFKASNDQMDCIRRVKKRRLFNNGKTERRTVVPHYYG